MANEKYESDITIRVNGQTASVPFERYVTVKTKALRLHFATVTEEHVRAQTRLLLSGMRNLEQGITIIGRTIADDLVLPQ